MDEQTTQLLLIRSYKQSKIRKIKHTLRQMFVLSNAVLPCLGFTLCCSYIKSHRRTSLNSRHDVRVVLCADSRGHRKTHTHNRGFAIRQSCSLIHIETLAFIYSNSTSLSFSHSLMYFSSTHIYKHTHSLPIISIPHSPPWCKRSRAEAVSLCYGFPPSVYWTLVAFY